MRVPISWLKEYVDITLPIEELGERLTLAGMEVDADHEAIVTVDRLVGAVRHRSGDVVR